MTLMNATVFRILESISVARQKDRLQTFVRAPLPRANRSDTSHINETAMLGEMAERDPVTSSFVACLGEGPYDYTR